jgi:putative membrane protein
MRPAIRSIALRVAFASAVVGCAHQEPPANGPNGPGDMPLPLIGDGGDAAALTAVPPSGAQALVPVVDPATLTVSNGLPTAAIDPANDVPSNAATDLGDAQILEATQVANRDEIEQAELAQAKGRDAQVKALAAIMIKELSEATSNGVALAKAVGLMPASSATSMALEEDTRNATSVLKVETGAGFDRRYADAQVKEQRAVLEALEEKLLPNAKNPHLKAYLTEVQVAAAARLERAQSLQRQLDVKARGGSLASGI